jgi:PIN domain nuclease of toxin-antitoxin system
MTRSILLDTHFVLWVRGAPEALTAKERQAIEAASVRYVSAASFWEIAILAGLGRIPSDGRLFDIAPGLELLPVEPRHCRELAKLPKLHRDPFDRMLIAQARADDLTLVTRDEKIVSYGRDGAMCAELG